MKTLDDDKVQRIFERLNLVAAGEPMIEAAAAVQDLYCAVLCVMADDIDEAIALATAAHDDIRATIRKNFEHYRQSAARDPDVAAGRA